ncbi:DUF3040 domain-containing protein [Quadrisphaera sp. DSM 44207]|uniref:DUF3040 domain-containing protein n=1 Tax=Quadrisphaera sp. DSM 44207 TaxID=1881057 RepID=UPI000884F91E|nr:DUF3040 domain-containing protein [Quadrisphaera sp. DSM 44207]SDQ53920.1 Protein of unknown function [Quadrisphaera sp. DSM 44207]
MPLSDHEQRLLEQMEQQLLSDDPRFASTMRGPRSVPAARRRIVIGVVAVLVGLGVLVLAVVQRSPWIGAGAFVLMLGGLVYALSAPTARSRPLGVVRGGARPAAHPSRGGRGKRPSPRSPRSGTFMQRLEQRWERRRDDRWG